MPYTNPENSVCVCLEVGTSPSTGSAWEAELIERGIDHCEDILEDLGAITTDCEEIVPWQDFEYRGVCDDPE